MKKSLIFLLGITLMSFNTTTNVKTNKSSNQQQREIQRQASVLIRGQWYQGFVFITNDMVTRVQFPEIQVSGTYRMTAQMYQPERVGYLNANNPIAVQNNLTNYVDIPNYGRAYFNL